MFIQTNKKPTKNKIHPENEVGIKWNNGKMEDWEERKKEWNDGMLDSPVFQHSNIPVFQDNYVLS